MKSKELKNMRNRLILVLILLLTTLITGCDNKKEKVKVNEKEEKITCTMIDESLKSEIEYVFIDDYASEMELKIDANFTSEEEAESFAQFYKEKGAKVKLDGTKFNATYKEEIDKESQKYSSNSKDTIIADAMAAGYTCR